MKTYAVDYQEMCWQRIYVEAETPQDALRLIRGGRPAPEGSIGDLHTEYSEIVETEPFEVYELDENMEPTTEEPLLRV